MGVLDGYKVAFLVANEGIEQVELTEPWKAVQQAGGQPVLVAPKSGRAQAFHHLEKADSFAVDLTVEQASPVDYVGLVLPGGVANPDQLRIDPEAVAFAKGFVDAGKPVAVICHGPWTLVEAGVVRNRTLTSWPSLKTDILNAGGHWVDEEVKVCDGDENVIVSSRKPDDLPTFCRTFIEVFSQQAHREPQVARQRT
jgi:protease I